MVEVHIWVMLGVSETICVIAGRCSGALAQTVATTSILTSLFLSLTHTHTHTHTVFIDTEH